MPIFLIEVALQPTNTSGLVLLKDELADSSFVQFTDDLKQYPGRISLHFKQQAESICDVTAAVLKAVRKTGKNFSFTVIKSK